MASLSNLTQRILVAAVGIPIVIYLCFTNYALLFFVGVLALGTVHEYYGLAKMKGFIPQVILGMTFTALIYLTFASFRYPVHLQTTDLLSLVLIVGFLAIFIAELMRGYPNPLVQMAVSVAGAVYIGVGLGGFFGVHEYFYVATGAGKLNIEPKDVLMTAGYFTITMLSSIWICDTAAFSFGRKIGKTKISERVSPNKTYEGALSGLIFAWITWFVARAVIPQLGIVSIRTCIVMGIISGVFGQVGDFAESLLKRDVGVKDSSALIPGHGGLLDRLDSILFVSPLAYLYLHIFGL